MADRLNGVTVVIFVTIFVSIFVTMDMQALYYVLCLYNKVAAKDATQSFATQSSIVIM